MDQQLADYVAARWPALVRYATVVCGDTAEGEELAQAALVRLTARWWLMRDRSNLDSYVRTSIVRAHINQRGRLRRREHSMAQPPQVAVADQFEGVGRGIDIRRALASLPPRQRAVLALRYLDDLRLTRTGWAGSPDRLRPGRADPRDPGGVIRPILNTTVRRGSAPATGGA